MVKVLVCMKLVSDPEAPVSSFKVDSEAKQVIAASGSPPVINPFDENALEAALKLKDITDVKITIISMGQNLAKAVLRKTLAVGAEELILLDDVAFDDLNGFSTAFVLAAAIIKIGEFDIILCGRQSADTNAGQVGSGIAQILKIPCVTVVRQLKINDGKLTVERVVSAGYEIIEVMTPVLFTVGNESGELRAATLKAIMESQKKPIITWKAGDICLDALPQKQVNLIKLVTPPHSQISCQIVEGQSPEVAGVNLANKLKEVKII